jgi:hypothetical protein
MSGATPGGGGLKHILIADPRSDRDAAPAHAAGEAAHAVVALSPRAVLHGDGARAVAVEGRAEHAERGVALTHGRALEVEAIGVQLAGRGARVAVRLGLLEGRGQVGRLVRWRVRAIARGRLDVEGRGSLGHVVRRAVLRRAVWEQRKAAVARVLEQELGVGELADHKLVRLAVPGIERAGGILLAPEVWRGGLLHRRGDGGARCGGFARRVGEGWRRGLVGIQLHGGGGTEGCWV